MHDAVRFANAAAAIYVTRDGAQPAAPFRAEILRLLETEGTLADVAGGAHTSSSIVERDA